MHYFNFVKSNLEMKIDYLKNFNLYLLNFAIDFDFKFFGKRYSMKYLISKELPSNLKYRRVALIKFSFYLN